MAFIYDLDNEHGGAILADTDTGAPALQVNSNAAGYPAIACYSTASGSVIKATALSGPAFDGDSVSTTEPAADFRSGATIGPALIVGRTVNGSPTIGAVQFLGTSVASGAIMEFKGGFISCTSVLMTSAKHTDYAIPVSINGVQRYIVLWDQVEGAATF
jgi:hypothetical protein